MDTARGGPQHIPRPPGARRGLPAPWHGITVDTIDLDRVVDAVRAKGPAGPPPFTVPGARPAAVLVPLFDDDGQAHVLLTRRSSTLRHHRGDVAFPGGRTEPGETVVAAALREAEEEIGLPAHSVDIVGELDHLTTVVSRFEIAPVVGRLPGRPVTTPNPGEIERVFDASLVELLGEGVYREEVWEIPGGEREVHFFELVGETVWGATARMLRDLLVLVTA